MSKHHGRSSSIPFAILQEEDDLDLGGKEEGQFSRIVCDPTLMDDMQAGERVGGCIASDLGAVASELSEDDKHSSDKEGSSSESEAYDQYRLTLNRSISEDSSLPTAEDFGPAHTARDKDGSSRARRSHNDSQARVVRMRHRSLARRVCPKRLALDTSGEEVYQTG